jgi:hypothetical protein
MSMAQTPAPVTAAPRPAPTQWNTTPIERPLATTQAMAASQGFWSRLGRGFFNTFSPAYKD